MILHDPNILGVERYAEACYYQDLMFNKDWPRHPWDEISPEDRNRYRRTALELISECKLFARQLSHAVDASDE